MIQNHFIKIPNYDAKQNVIFVLFFQMTKFPFKMKITLFFRERENFSLPMDFVESATVRFVVIAKHWKNWKQKNNDINTSVVIIIIIVDIGTNTPLPPPTLRNQFLSNANIEKVKKEWKKYFCFCFSRPLQRLRPFSPVTMMQPLKTGKKLVRLFEIFSFTF